MRNGHLERTAENRLLLFSGSGFPELAESIAARLDLDLGEVELTQFSNGEMYARYEQSIRGADVFIVQSLGEPVNDNLMQLLIMIDAARRASAKRITAVIPWFAYSRQDRKTKPREPITARLVANMIQVAGADRVMTMDLHVGQIEGFFSFPVDHLTAMHTFVDCFVEEGFRDADDAVVVAPDTGEVKVAKRLADHLGLPWAIVNKMRRGPGESEVTHVIGDVAGKRAIMIDDLIDTAGTLCNAAERLIEEGATEAYACATHAVFSDDAYKRIEASPLKEVVVTDTLPLKEGEPRSKIRTLSIAPILRLRRAQGLQPLGHVQLLALDEGGDPSVEEVAGVVGQPERAVHAAEPGRVGHQHRRDAGEEGDDRRPAQRPDQQPRDQVDEHDAHEEEPHRAGERQQAQDDADRRDQQRARPLADQQEHQRDGHEEHEERLGQDEVLDVEQVGVEEIGR